MTCCDGSLRCSRVLVALSVLLLSVPALAQTFEGEAGVSYAWQDVNGSEDSYYSQYWLQDGFNLDALRLRWRPVADAHPLLTFDAWGFGTAEPQEHARLELRPASFRIGVSYDRGESFFALAEPGYANYRDRWEIERWKGWLTWEGWSAARLALTYRQVEQSGTAARSIFGLGTFYPLAVDLDRTMHEASFRIETRTLPVFISFEQAWAVYETADRWQPAGEQALGEHDPDLLTGATLDRESEVRVPTSRLLVAWRKDRVDLGGSLLYAPARLEVSGGQELSYAIGGGDIGSSSFLDRLSGSGESDVWAGQFRFGYGGSEGWSTRLLVDYRDGEQDTRLAGEQIVRLVSPIGGEIELEQALDDESVLDYRDTTARAEVAWSNGCWSAWAGLTAAWIDRSWLLSVAAVDPSYSRDLVGSLFGIEWRDGQDLVLRGEIRHGAADGYVYRIQPDEVDQFLVTLHSALGRGWAIDARVRYDRAAAPDDATDLRSQAWDVGAEANWTGTSGSSVGLTAGTFRFDYGIDVVGPAGAPGVYAYNVNLFQLGARGRLRLGRFTLDGDYLSSFDAGKSWPFRFWTADARAAVDVVGGLELGLFGRWQSFSQEDFAGDDYEVSRWGVSALWRF